MKILHLLYSGLGGHGNVFFSMFNADEGHAFEYAALFNGIEELRPDYIERCNNNGIIWNFIKKKPGLDMGFYKRLISAIKKADADIIFLHGSTQVLWAKIAGISGKKKNRLIVRETQANQLKTKQDWLWLIVAMLVADKIVFLSEAYKAEIRKKLSWIYREKKIAVIPNGIDLQQFKPVIKKDTGSIVIGMQSRIVKIKDHRTLLRAFDMLLKDPSMEGKKMMLKIAGDGDSRKELEQLTKELGIESNVRFTGMLTEQELVIFLDELDIYVHASYGETMSTAIMQAMACGKPVIASDVAGINNMITNDVTGILVPIEDAAAMFKKMKMLINDPEAGMKLAANARSYAGSNFSNELMFKKYKTIFLPQ